jgi:hypothetical protein
MFPDNTPTDTTVKVRTITYVAVFARSAMVNGRRPSHSAKLECSRNARQIPRMAPNTGRPIARVS